MCHLIPPLYVVGTPGWQHLVSLGGTAPCPACSVLGRARWQLPFPGQKAVGGSFQDWGLFRGDFLVCFFFSFCCKISSVGMGINKETRLCCPSCPGHRQHWIRALGPTRGTELHKPSASGARTGRTLEWAPETTCSGVLLCRLAFPPLGWCFSPGSSCPKRPSRLRWPLASL